MSEEKGCVLVSRFGGLGNQMFQVAAGIIYAKETDKLLIIPNDSERAHCTILADYADILFDQWERINEPIGHSYDGFEKYPDEPGFQPWRVFHHGPLNVLMVGYWQYYPPICRHEALIRSCFAEKLAPFCEKSYVGCVGVHVRRGDYLQYPDFHYIQTEEYYEQAMTKFPPKTTFVIFSDDLQWCTEQPCFAECIFHDESNEIVALATMISCDAGFICGNSTFSWWGAFLGAYAKRRTVCVPRNWIATTVHDLFPTEWEII